MTLTDIANNLEHVKQKIAEHNASIKALNEEKKNYERMLLEELNKLGVDQVKLNGRAYAPKEELVPVIEDWDAFYNYIKDNNAFYLLQRRPSATAFREAFELYGTDGIPGVTSATVVKLQDRKV